jgi:hypothetical protein
MKGFLFPMKAFVFASLLLLSATVSAAADAPVQLDLSKGDLASQRVAITKAINGNDYSEFGSDERTELSKLLDSIEQNPTASEQNLASQKRANAILSTAYSDSKQICRQVKEIGSNMSKRSCMTMAAKRRAAEKAKFDTATPIRVN